MNNQILKGKWNELKGDVKAKWGKLTDDDIKESEGNYDQLVGKIQTRYGQSLDEAKKSVDEFFIKLGK